MTFTVGYKLMARTEHVAVEAQDALAAALEVKARHPEAVIVYSRPQNRRGDARHPVHELDSEEEARGQQS
ncbi:MAG: hypothetical protein RO009_14480 [Pseudorhodoplanes sp.]|nr:hypothetical protein [Pseudorhodoplanes sp.]